MADELSKPRDADEINRGRFQPEFFGRGNAVEEMQAAVADREAKTARLREARLAKDRRDMMAAAAAKLATRAPEERPATDIE